MKKINLSDYLKEINLEEMTKEALLEIDGGCTIKVTGSKVLCGNITLTYETTNPCKDKSDHEEYLRTYATRFGTVGSIHEFAGISNSHPFIINTVKSG